MFPGRLPSLSDFRGNAPHLEQFISINPGGGGGIGGGGIGNGPTLTMPPITIGGGSGGSGSTGKTTTVGIGGAIAGGLSSVLGIPAINWGRLAAFLLGLLFIAAGLYLLRPVQQIVNQTVKSNIKDAIAA